MDFLLSGCVALNYSHRRVSFKLQIFITVNSLILKHFNSNFVTNSISYLANLSGSAVTAFRTMSSTTHYGYRQKDWQKECQVIDGHFVDQRKLISLLKKHYGCTDEGNNFSVKVKHYSEY